MNGELVRGKYRCADCGKKCVIGGIKTYNAAYRIDDDFYCRECTIERKVIP